MIGPLDIGYSRVGAVVQALGECLIDRGYDKDEIVDRLTSDHFDEPEFWLNEAGPAVDALARAIGLEPYPEED